MESTSLEFHVRVGDKIGGLRLPMDRRPSVLIEGWSLTAWHTQLFPYYPASFHSPTENIFQDI